MLRPINTKSLFNQLDYLRFVDVPKILAYKKTRIYMGRGLEFKHENQEIHKKWHRFVELNDFEQFMFNACELMSEMGSVAVSINKNQLGEPLINLANPYYSQGIETSYGTTDFAVLIETTQVDNNLYIIRSAYDKEKVIRTLWNANTKEQMNLFGYVSKLPKEKQLDWGTYDEETNSYVYYHNLGIVPCVILVNKPFRLYFPNFGSNIYYQSPFTTTVNYETTGYGYDSVKDTALCSGLIEQLQNLYTQMNKLVILDKPRIILSGVNQTTAQQLRRDNKALASYLDEVIIKANTTGPNVDIAAPTNTLDYYQNAIVSTWIDIFKASGLSFLTQSGTQKTAQESVNSFQDSVEELNYMRNFWTNQWIKVIKCAMKVFGVELGEKEKWSFQVKKNIITDEASLADRLIKQIQVGTTTPVQYISIMEGVDEDNAEQIWKENSKWFKENDFPIAMKDGGGAVSGVKGASLPTSKEKGGAPEKGKGEE